MSSAPAPAPAPSPAPSQTGASASTPIDDAAVVQMLQRCTSLSCYAQAMLAEQRALSTATQQLMQQRKATADAQALLAASQQREAALTASLASSCADLAAASGMVSKRTQQVSALMAALSDLDTYVQNHIDGVRDATLQLRPDFWAALAAGQDAFAAFVAANKLSGMFVDAAACTTYFRRVTNSLFGVLDSLKIAVDPSQPASAAVQAFTLALTDKPAFVEWVFAYLYVKFSPLQPQLVSVITPTQ